MVRSSSERSYGFYIGLATWGSVCVLLVHHDLGVIAFVGSVFVAIAAWGLRDKFASETTGSAYSVFNTNGQAIAGGFTMNQLDRQIRGGFGSPSGEPSGEGSIMAQAVASNSGNTNAKNISETERLRRRRDAAAAAEKRVNS